MIVVGVGVADGNCFVDCRDYYYRSGYLTCCYNETQDQRSPWDRNGSGNGIAWWWSVHNGVAVVVVLGDCWGGNLDHCGLN